MATILDTLITDRTQDDVDRVYELKKKYPSWSSSEQREWNAGMRGAYNASDMNRVGEACKYLYEYFIELGILVEGYTTPKTNWTVSDVPTKAQESAYLNNLYALKNTVSAQTKLPNGLSAITYDDANNIEKLLLEVEMIVNAIAAGFLYSGEFESGEF